MVYICADVEHKQHFRGTKQLAPSKWHAFRMATPPDNTASSNIRSQAIGLTINGRSLCLSVCPSNISTTVHPIDLTLGGCIAENPKKCSVKCEVVRMSGSGESCKQQCRRPSNRLVPNRRVLNGQCTSRCNSENSLAHVVHMWCCSGVFIGLKNSSGLFCLYYFD